jgi:hypothetical protein
MSFALRLETIEELKRVAEESGIVGGRSTIMEDAARLWLGRYRTGHIDWLRARGMPIQGEPAEDDGI